MKSSSIEKMFEEAFGLNETEMKELHPYYVGEANVGVLSVDSSDGVNSTKMSRVLYAVKKNASPRIRITVENLETGEKRDLTVTQAHKFGCLRSEAIGSGDAEESDIQWISAKAISGIQSQVYLIGSEFELYAVKSCEDLPADHTLDIQVEGTENYFSNGLLSHNSMYGPDFQTTGGYAIKYYSSWRGRITRVDWIKEKGVEVGIYSKVRNTKNKIGVPRREAHLELKFSEGFDSDNEYVKFLIDLGLIEQKGAWFYNEDWGLKANGRDAVFAFLRENPEIFTLAKNTVNSALSGATILDEENEEDALNSEEEEYMEAQKSS